MADEHNLADPLAQLNGLASVEQCRICSRLDEYERGYQKIGHEEDDEFLPAAAGELRVVSEPDRLRQLRQCPECTTCYEYRSEYELLIGGSEDSQELRRLTVVETLEWLKVAATGRRWTVSAPAGESISVDDSEPGFVRVDYVMIEDGIDMGGRLWLERQCVPSVVDMLNASLHVYATPESARRCGGDDVTVYESGPGHRPYTNVLNRRPTDASHGGLSGLMLTRWAGEELMARLCALM